MEKIKMSISFFIVIVLVIAFSSINLRAQTYNKQNTYLDALELKDLKDSNPDEFNSILLKYGNESGLSRNPFLKGELEIALPNKNYEKSDEFPEIEEEKTTHHSRKYSPYNLYSTNWQASAVNGLANFMAGRFRQEVFQMSINQIFKKIKTEDNYNLVQYIFPKTFKYVKDLYGVGSSSYYTADLLLLRQTAQIDMEQLPQNIVKNPELIFPKIKEKPEIKDMITFSNHIIDNCQQGQTLDQIITSVADVSYSPKSKVSSILNVSDIISQALMNKDKSANVWVNPVTELPPSKKSLENPEIKYFYGLLYQQLVQLPEFNAYLTSSNDPTVVAGKIQNLILFVNKLNTTYDYIKSKEFNLKTTDEIITYIDNINQSISTFTKTIEKIPEINQYYNFNDSITDLSSKYISLVNATLRKDYQKVIPLLIINLGDYVYKENSSLRTLSFVAQLATIETAQDMEALLNAYALPIGSSSIKRHSSFNLSLNGYVGFTGGFETAYGSEVNQTRKNIGLSAPIGISSTFMNGKLTAFVSFIDLGSIVNQRLGNDINSYSNLKFEQFFAPGIGLFYNFPKLPVSAGAHFNYIPNLRTIKYESGNAIITESSRNVTRLNLSLLVDIPLYTFYNVDKRDKVK